MADGSIGETSTRTPCDTIGCCYRLGHPGDCYGDGHDAGAWEVRAREIKGLSDGYRKSLAAWIARVDGPREKSIRVSVTDCGEVTRTVERKVLPRPIVREETGRGARRRADLERDWMAAHDLVPCETTGRLFRWESGEAFMWGETDTISRVAKGQITPADWRTAPAPCSRIDWKAIGPVTIPAGLATFARAMLDSGIRPA